MSIVNTYLNNQNFAYHTIKTHMCECINESRKDANESSDGDIATLCHYLH